MDAIDIVRKQLAEYDAAVKFAGGHRLMFKPSLLGYTTFEHLAEGCIAALDRIDALTAERDRLASAILKTDVDLTRIVDRCTDSDARDWLKAAAKRLFAALTPPDADGG